MEESKSRKGEERRKAAPPLGRPKQPDVAGAGGMPSPAAAPNTGFPGTNNAFAGERIKGHEMGYSTLPACSGESEGSPWPSLTVLFPLPRAGLPMAARAADDRRGPPPPPPPLSSAGRRRENRITKMIYPKKSHLTPCTSLSKTFPRTYGSRSRGATTPWSVAYLFSPCFGLS